MTTKELNSTNKLGVESSGPSHSRSSNASSPSINDSCISFKASGINVGLMVVVEVMMISVS